jgi:hypothetical protein
MKKFVFGLIFSACWFALPVAAQIMSNPAQWYINNQIYSTRVFNGVVANSMFRRGANRQNPSRQQNKQARDFTSFRAAPNNTLPKMLAGKSPGGRETEQILDGFIGLYHQTAQKDGFPANDLAYAFEYFVVNNYMVYHDLYDLPAEKDPRLKRARDGFERIELANQKRLLQVSIAAERTVYNQFREVLAANAEIQKMTDAQKQEATELLAIMFGINFAVYQKGINDGDDKLMQQARELSKQGLEKLLGVSISQIKISESGLEIN